MATYENCRTISVQAAVASSASTVIANRFVVWQGTTPAEKEVVIHVPGANGAAARGICAMKPDAKAVVNGFAETTMALPDGGVAKVELGEAITTVGQVIRVGGNSTEVDGAAYMADATGDVIVGYALETGAIGEVIAIEFVGYAGTAP